MVAFLFVEIKHKASQLRVALTTTTKKWCTWALPLPGSNSGNNLLPRNSKLPLCDGLNKNVPDRVWNLNTWPPVGLGKRYSPTGSLSAALGDKSLCFMFEVEDVRISEFPAPAARSASLPSSMMGSYPSRALMPGKPFQEVALSHGYFIAATEKQWIHFGRNCLGVEESKYFPRNFLVLFWSLILSVPPNIPHQRLENHPRLNFQFIKFESVWLQL